MFRFSLQTVLDVRTRQERIKYKEYSQELIRQQALLGRIHALENDLRRAGQSMDQMRQGSGVTAYPLQMHTMFRQRVASEIAVLQQQLREQEEALEAKRQELVQARRDYRTMEILRDKERVRYDAEEARRERNVMDEAAANYVNHPST